MYQNSKEYNRMAKLVTDLYIDYNIYQFPIDAYEIANRMGFSVKFYSDFETEELLALKGFSEDGTNLPLSNDKMHSRLILINDAIMSNARKEITVFHEIKHIVDYDEDDSQLNEDMAEYFAKYFKCPIPYLIYRMDLEPYSIMNKYNVSSQMAHNVARHLQNRIRRYGFGIFESELPLLKQILKDNYNEDLLQIISDEE